MISGTGTPLHRGVRSLFRYIVFILFSLSALVITETELRLIAKAASIGLSNRPKKG